MRRLILRSNKRATSSGAPEVEVVPDDALEEGSARLGTVEDPGVGELDLAEGEVVEDAPPEVLAGKGRGQADLPPPEEALHRAGPEAIADALEDGGILAGQKAVVELFERHLRLVQLTLRPLVAVQVDPRREGRVGVGLDEGRSPLGVEQVEVEVVDHRHLPSPPAGGGASARCPSSSTIATPPPSPGRCRRARRVPHRLRRRLSRRGERIPSLDSPFLK